MYISLSRTHRLVLQELLVLHVIPSRNVRYRHRACSWLELAIGQKLPFAEEMQYSEASDRCLAE